MPSERQGRSRGQGRQNGGASGQQAHGVSDRLRETGQQFREQAGHVGDQVRESYESARETVTHGYRQAEGMIARNPAPSVLIGFGIGFGLGILLTTLLMPEEEEHWYDRRLDNLRHLGDRLRDLHLLDRLRDLPETVARSMPHR